MPRTSSSSVKVKNAIQIAGSANHSISQNSPNVRKIVKTSQVYKTFVRLRDISLTYNFPFDKIKRLGLANASVSVYGKNLAMWTPNANPYIDPELSTFGDGLLSEQGEFGANPSQRSFGAALKLTF